MPTFLHMDHGRAQVIEIAVGRLAAAVATCALFVGPLHNPTSTFLRLGDDKRGICALCSPSINALEIPYGTRKSAACRIMKPSRAPIYCYECRSMGFGLWPLKDLGCCLWFGLCWLGRKVYEREVSRNN